jgi:hypothetical protein
MSKMVYRKTEIEKWLWTAHVFVLVLLVGIIFQSLVLFANECKMPVKSPYQYDVRHFSFDKNEDITHWYFSDIFTLGKYMYSIGDVFLILGASGYVISLIVVAIKKHKLLGGKKC